MTNTKLLLNKSSVQTWKKLRVQPLCYGHFPFFLQDIPQANNIYDQIIKYVLLFHVTFIK